MSKIMKPGGIITALLMAWAFSSLHAQAGRQEPPANRDNPPDTTTVPPTPTRTADDCWRDMDEAIRSAEAFWDFTDQSITDWINGEIADLNAGIAANAEVIEDLEAQKQIKRDEIADLEREIAVLETAIANIPDVIYNGSWSVTDEGLWSLLNGKVNEARQQIRDIEAAIDDINAEIAGLVADSARRERLKGERVQKAREADEINARVEREKIEAARTAYGECIQGLEQ